jgi:hypothetical protein
LRSATTASRITGRAQNQKAYGHILARCAHLDNDGNRLDDVAHGADVVHHGGEGREVANSRQHREGKEVLLVALAKDEAGAGGDAVEERVDNVAQPREEPLAGAARIMANEMGR